MGGMCTSSWVDHRSDDIRSVEEERHYPAEITQLVGRKFVHWETDWGVFRTCLAGEVDTPLCHIDQDLEHLALDIEAVFPIPFVGRDAGLFAKLPHHSIDSPLTVFKLAAYAVELTSLPRWGGFLDEQHLLVVLIEHEAQHVPGHGFSIPQ